MPRKLTPQEIVDRCTKAHNGDYEYSIDDLWHKTKKGHLKVICREHGAFYISYSSHSKGKGHCANCCGRVNKGNKEHFVKRAKEKHGELYDYSLSEYVDCDADIIVICREHGAFTTQPSNHYAGNGCPTCRYIKSANSQRKSNEDYLISLGETLNKFDILSEYKGAFEKVKVKCRSCGCTFSRGAKDLLYNSNCPLCESVSGFDVTKDGLLYYLKFSSPYGVFWKIGVTNRTLEQRFAIHLKKGYSFESLYEIQQNGQIVSDKETEILRCFKDHKIEVTEKFDGYTECFSTDISKLPGFFEIFNRPN